MDRLIAAVAAIVVVCPVWAQDSPLPKAADIPQAQASAGGSLTRMCLAGNEFVALPVTSGQRLTVTPSKQAQCDERGWTNGAGLAFYGPEGSNQYPGQMGAGPYTPLGMLVGAFSHQGHGEYLSWNEENQIFYGKALLLGGTIGKYVVVSPIDGYLYMLMNDGAQYGDNLGKIYIEVVQN